jgi:hypothetical protein
MLTPDFLVKAATWGEGYPDEKFAIFDRAFSNANSFAKDTLSTLPLFDDWFAWKD